VAAGGEWAATGETANHRGQIYYTFQSKFDGWLCLGDLMDFNINNLRGVEGKTAIGDGNLQMPFPAMA
jgi:hypothetical protein